MKSKYIFGVCLSLLGLSPAATWAKESCSPAKKLVEATRAFYVEKPELIDIIAPELQVGLSGINGHPNPTHMLYRWQDEELRLPITNGRVENIEAVAARSPEGELCSVYADGPLPETDEPTVSLSVSFTFPFRRKDGVFSVKELKEGAKDGSKIMKSLAPGGLGFVVPGLKSIVIGPAKGSDTPLRFEFLRNAESLSVPSTVLAGRHYIRLKDIKSANADQLSIAGPYTLTAMFKFDPEELAEAEAKRLAGASE